MIEKKKKKKEEDNDNGRMTTVQVVIDHSVDIAFSHYVKHRRARVCVCARACCAMSCVCVRVCVVLCL